MRKIIALISIYLFSVSCVKDVERIKAEGYVYDYQTKKPLQNVKITQILDGKKTLLVKTSENGYFEVKKITKMTFGMKSHVLSNMYFLEKKGYQTDTIEVYGGVNETFIKDSILMKPFLNN